MKKETFLLLLLALLLLAGMILTLISDGGRSRHGIGTSAAVGPQDPVQV